MRSIVGFRCLSSLMSDAGDLVTISSYLIQVSVQFMSVVCEECYFISVKKERRRALHVAAVFSGRLLYPESSK